MEERGNSTKQLKKVLGFWDLFSTAVGQIIGAGIMTLVGAAIAMTGRSVPIAFLIAAYSHGAVHYPDGGHFRYCPAAWRTVHHGRVACR